MSEATPPLKGNELTETFERILAVGQSAEAKNKSETLARVQLAMADMPPFIKPYILTIEFHSESHHTRAFFDVRGLIPSMMDGKLKHGIMRIMATKYFPRDGAQSRPTEWHHFQRAGRGFTWKKCDSPEHAIFCAWQDDIDLREEYHQRGEAYPPTNEQEEAS